MATKTKTKEGGSRVAERPKLTDAAVKKRGADGRGKAEKKGEAQGEGGVRCSALLGGGLVVNYHAPYGFKVDWVGSKDLPSQRITLTGPGLTEPE